MSFYICITITLALAKVCKQYCLSKEILANKQDYSML